MGWSWFVGTEREAPFAGLVAFGGVGDADAGRGGELEDRAVAFKPKTFGGDEILAVESAIDLKELGQLARTVCALDAADQHCLRMSFNACHDVQHFVHPVAEIDVGATAGRIHHVSARGPSLVRMTGGILFAAVGLRLGDAPTEDRTVVEPTAKKNTDERFCRRHRIDAIIRRHEAS